MFNKGMEIPVVFFEEEGKGGGDNQNPKHDEHLQQTIKERDEAKAKFKEAEKTSLELKSKLQAIEDSKKIEAGEFQKLADDYKKKLDEVNPEIERLKKVEADHKEYIENRKKSILETIPEDKRTDWQDADLKTLEKVAPLYNTGQILGTDYGKGGKVIITTNRTWDDFNLTELDELEKSNKSEYERLYNQKYKKKVSVI
jgi:hypothetical protein